MKPRKGSCIEWSGCNTGKDGYGIINLSRDRRLVAHRVIYEGVHGRLPKELVVDHICRNKRCVNIKHLRAITNAENVLCGEGITANNKRKTVCKLGHPLSVRGNTGWRECHTCKLESNRRTKKLRMKLTAIRQMGGGK